jgi:alpha-ketoglutarate-dependent taurine dioxygenase
LICILVRMKTSSLNQKGLPLVVEPGEGYTGGAVREHLLRLCRDNRDSLREKLLTHGALLLRGMPVLTATEFAAFVRAFSGGELLDYTGGASPRIKLGGGVYTSTEYAETVTLSLHNELSYTYRWPARLFFCCVTPPEEGGETPLADSRAILRGIDAEILSLFKRKKIRYVRNLSGIAGGGFSWQDAFETFDKAAVENYCRAGAVEFEWKEDGGLWLSETRPATRLHPATEDEVWFNQAEGFHPSALDAETYRALISIMKEEEFRLNAYFGDGASIDPSMLEHIREVVRREMVLVEWQAGDILILDNLLAAHGRMPFKGARRILLAMT